FDCGDLVDELRLEILRPLSGNAPAAKTVEVHEGRVRTDGHAFALCREYRLSHHDGIARVKPASDVCRRDEAQHRVVIADLVGTKAFAHVAVQIYFRHQALPCVSRLANTRSRLSCSATHICSAACCEILCSRIGMPLGVCTSRARSAEATVAILG